MGHFKYEKAACRTENDANSSGDQGLYNQPRNKLNKEIS